MKTPILLLTPLLLLLISCGTTEPKTESTLFEFQVDEQIYQIIGMNSPDGEAINDLVLRENQNILIWVRDTNQDGFMDLILRGDVSLEEANRIYHTGIRKAAELGKYQQREFPRTYRYETDEHIFSIITVLADMADPTNTFIIHDKADQLEIRLKDTTMNGLLDESHAGEPEYEIWQNQYRNTLERGVKEQKIEQINGRYFVKIRDSMRQPISRNTLHFN